MAREEPAVLEAQHINVAFGAVKALTDVSFTAHRGEVVALVGDNGAGKSTLLKALSGIHRPDSGSLKRSGVEIQLGTPRQAVEAGIATVFQDLALCDDLDVVSNLFLGREMTTSASLLDEIAMELEAQALLDMLNAKTISSVRSQVRQLSGGQRQSIAIARSLRGEPDIILLDEPTAALGIAQTHEVLSLIRRLRERGISVVLISHNLADVFAVSDRIHVLRLGRTNGVFATNDVTANDVVSAITGAVDHTLVEGRTE